jgi:adenosylhomocysteine nucleosidase
MKRVAVIAALPAELAPLVREWRRERRGGVSVWSGARGGVDCVAACAGMGAAAALRALMEAERSGSAHAIVSYGWAGALRPGLEPGSAWAAAGAIDEAGGRRFPAPASAGAPWVVTVGRMAGREEKRRLAAATGASLVDMEAGALARVAAERGVAFLCLKGVSDAWDETPLPDMDRFISPQGAFRTAAFVLFAAVRPWHWAALARLYRHSRRAARALSRLFPVNFPW